MPIRHTYEKVRGKNARTMPPLGHEIVLEDGTSILLPQEEASWYHKINVGDRVLVDYHDSQVRDTVNVTVFRDGEPLASFRSDKEYTGGGRSSS